MSREAESEARWRAANYEPPDPSEATSLALVVFERNDVFDMQSGPCGYERVGFCIGDRVFWTGCGGSGLPPSSYAEGRNLAEEVVRRWNDLAARAEREALKAERDAWRDAIIDAALVWWTLDKGHGTDPRKAVNALLAQAQKEALDPTVSEKAHELVQRAEQAEASVSALQRELEGAKDDRDTWRKEAIGLHPWYERATIAERELEETRQHNANQADTLRRLSADMAAEAASLRETIESLRLEVDLADEGRREEVARLRAQLAAVQALSEKWRDVDTDGHAHDPAVAFNAGLVQCADELDAALSSLPGAEQGTKDDDSGSLGPSVRGGVKADGHAGG